MKVEELKAWNENIERMVDRFSKRNAREERYALFIPFGPGEEGLIWVQAIFTLRKESDLKAIFYDVMNRFESQIQALYCESAGIKSC